MEDRMEDQVKMENLQQSLPKAPSSLCFNKDEFLKSEFHVEQFLVECRRRASMETMRDDLGIYLKVLQSAMIELINKDYADFVNLSTNLVGLDKVINNLMHPLGQLRQDVQTVKKEMGMAIDDVQDKLRKQAEIRHKKTTLARLRSIIHSVEKMEKLLGIQRNDNDPVVEYPSELSGQLIERVATQFNKLQFFVNKSRGLPLVEDIKPRIANITTTLQFSLEGSFREGLETNDTAILRQCLRTYATIDKMRDAENLFRQHTVKPYMEEVISEQFLNENATGLKGMYTAILDFMPKYCKILKEVTSGNIPGGGEVVRGYDFIVNAVWPEVVTNIEARVPSIFAPGNPNVFHERYSVSMEFVERYERQCGSQTSVKRLRAHPSYNTFMSKWSLPVYFQIRFQEIAGTFESSLINPFESSQGGKYHLMATESLWMTLQQCWQPAIFLPSLCHRFWKLTLQLLSRYATWLSTVANTQLKEEEIKVESETVPTMKNGSGEPPGVTDSQREDPRLSLKQIVLMVADVYSIHDQVPVMFDTLIQPVLSQLGIQDVSSFKESICESQAVLLGSMTQFDQHLTEEIMSQCAPQLKNVSDIPRLYRRTNREKPSKASNYVDAVMKPLKSFHEEHRDILLKEKTDLWSIGVLESVMQQYLSVTTNVLTSVKNMEESLKRLKKGRGTAESKNKGLSDDDKIRLQLQLDVAAFGKQIGDLGLSTESMPVYKELFLLVENAIESANNNS